MPFPFFQSSQCQNGLVSDILRAALTASARTAAASACSLLVSNPMANAFSVWFGNSAPGVSKSVRESAVDLHVVEPAQAGLNSFQSGGEHFAAAFNLATLIHALEELARITNFSDGDAKLVAAARVRHFQFLRLLDDLARAARKLAGREIGDENVTTRHDEQVARREPIPPASQSAHSSTSFR